MGQLIDLHTHSSASDGSDPPADLVASAAAAGLDIVALTDHDTTEGWSEAADAAVQSGIRLVPGIEISTTWKGAGVHLLAYLVDPDDVPLMAELRRIREDRRRRLTAIVARLASSGMSLDVDEILAAAGPAVTVGRPHVADAMVARGYVHDREEAFSRWLATDRIGYVPKYGPQVVDAIRLVRAAGGVSVLAHPWGRESRWRLDSESLATLAAAGLDGLEVDHADHPASTRSQLRALAVELDVAVTGSSDYHGSGKAGHDLGINTTAPDQWERLESIARARQAHR